MTLAGIFIVFFAVLLLCAAGIVGLIAGIAAAGASYRSSLLMILVCAGLTLLSGYMVGRAEIDFKIKMEASSVRK